MILEDDQLKADLEHYSTELKRKEAQLNAFDNQKIQLQKECWILKGIVQYGQALIKQQREGDSIEKVRKIAEDVKVGGK